MIRKIPSLIPGVPWWCGFSGDLKASKEYGSLEDLKGPNPLETAGMMYEHPSKQQGTFSGVTDVTPDLPHSPLFLLPGRGAVPELVI